MNEQMANIVEALLELDEADGASLQTEVIRENIATLYRKAMDRTVMLQVFVGMAQERTWPSLETVNEARVLMGMHELESLPGSYA